MPSQEIYFARSTHDTTVKILKVYDASFAKEAFSLMSEPALHFLASSLDLDETIATESTFSQEDLEGLWEGIEEGARESWNTFSYFVVEEEIGRTAVPRFVCADWPTSEAFVKNFFPEVVSSALAL